MQITIKGSKKIRNVPDALAKVLIAKGVAYETREVGSESPKPKRQYRRRDMKAED